MSAGGSQRGVRFSIVTVSLNNLPGIRRTWLSLCDQEPSFEWVVVDGGSHDGTRDWLATLDSQVKWLSEPDDGIYDAMNKGAHLASGELLLFLNAGDTLMPGALEVVSRDQEDRSWFWGYGTLAVSSSDGTLVEIRSFTPFRPRHLQLGLRAVPHPCCFFERDFYSSLEGYSLDFPIAADQELCFRAGRVADPRVMAYVIADFVADGISSAQGPGAFILQARRIRMTNRQTLFGHAVLDAAVTCALYIVALMRHLLSKALERHSKASVKSVTASRRA